ncbi:MAG: DUF4760 domain-containing protein [Pirellulaceae bacterium]
MTETLWLALTAVGTWGLVGVTLWMAERQRKLTLTDLQVRRQLLFMDRWESKPIRKERVILARQLLANDPDAKIREIILEFWESVGTYWLKGYLLEDLVWTDFAYYVTRWWAACKAYVDEVRCREHNDETIYLYLEKLAQRMREMDARERGLEKLEELGTDDLRRFLEDEASLED